MAFFQKGLKATVMTTELLINADVSKKILYECLEIATNFEKKYSAYQENSLLSQINRASGVKSVVCTPQEIEIFQKALEIAKLSDGKFDPTIGALTQGLYGFGMKDSKMPSESQLQTRKKLVSYKFIEINKSEIYLKHKGMQLDLGAIGKGYVADKIIEHLIDRGASKALVCVGGEICTFGKKYKIAIRDPFSHNNISLVTTSKTPLTLSTSGDYERFIGSRKNHHILDTQSAKQQHFYSSVTLLKNGIDATTLDAIATIVFNSRVEELGSLAEKFQLTLIAISPQKSIIIENFANLQIESFKLYPFEF